MFDYKISVIVPVYNVEKLIRTCLDSLVAQTIDKSLLEVLLINDGSPDKSIDICNEYASKYSFFKVFSKENEGLSRTRNFGIKHANGEYIAYLDSDDMLTPKSLESLVNFFDAHKDEVDIVTYKIVPYFNGVESKNLHYRYAYLHEEGVYDLTLPENTYLSQTNINICVKNFGEDNILFDTTEGFKHEDQKYNIDMVMPKMKIGYCTGAKYLYYQNPASITHTGFNAYSMYEATMAFWENLFAKFPDGVPKYLQAMYVNDVNWKMRSDILLPYHYKMEEGKYEKAISRIDALIDRIDDEVIVYHPKVEPLHDAFFVSRKKDTNLSYAVGSIGNIISNNGNEIYSETRVAFEMTNFKPFEDHVAIEGFLRTALADFVGDVKLYAHLTSKNGVEDIEIPLCTSNWDYYHCKIKTNHFFRAIFDWDYKKYSRVEFFVKVDDGREMPTKNDFVKFSPFHLELGRNKLFWNNKVFVSLENGFAVRRPLRLEMRISKAKYQLKIFKLDKRIAAVRLISDLVKRTKKRKRIWLYHDCRNVYKDNGYYQFIHDFEKNDGVERFYVVNDDLDRSELFTSEQAKHVIKFKSFKHRTLFFEAEKIVTAFIEVPNFSPVFVNNWQFFSDLFTAEIVYLQHGVLHAYLPWKYSKDRLPMVDKEVVSTHFEIDNLTHNYCFNEGTLIEAGMPRYDFIDADKAPEKKILFAPTWRKYLVTEDSWGAFHPQMKAFENSEFFKETYEFLHSERLSKMLKESGYVLEFKLHPIFKDYAKLYKLDGLENIRLAKESVDEASYKIFITDFSSYGFDFVYMKRTFFYFVPDLEKFYAGMNDYRQLDLPFEKGFGPLTTKSNEALDSLEGILKRDGEPDTVYKERMDNFFLYYDNGCRDRIYDAIK